MTSVLHLLTAKAEQDFSCNCSSELLCARVRSREPVSPAPSVTSLLGLKNMEVEIATSDCKGIKKERDWRVCGRIKNLGGEE